VTEQFWWAPGVQPGSKHHACELRVSRHPDGCKTAAFLSKELGMGGAGTGLREVVHGQVENLSDWEHKPLLPPSIRHSQDKISVCANR